jgi:hypothetical protein
MMTGASAALAKPNIEDRKLEMEIKKAAPLTVVDQAHGQMRLTRNESFAILGKSRFGVAGSWKVENGKLILRWQNSEESLELDVKNEKDGLRLGGQSKDPKGVYVIPAH